eukprot:TRINITY_DN2076_c0_g1_i1.p1 TRINITY_DN2076_c0_g1~~TRINITY_DN2076_c0_g1_i1.p1  ORF type:complete len:115 (-),score=29.06 TRINITY_DN2076_c0_g1_i1:59-403(-)
MGTPLNCSPFNLWGLLEEEGLSPVELEDLIQTLHHMYSTVENEDEYEIGSLDYLQSTHPEDTPNGRKRVVSFQRGRHHTTHTSPCQEYNEGRFSLRTTHPKIKKSTLTKIKLLH